MSSCESDVPKSSKGAPPIDQPVQNGFDVVFVGLILFAKRDRVALFPNGLVPAKSVTPHHPYLVVNPKRVSKEVGWEGVDQALKDLGIYQLPACRIDISGATTGGGVDGSQHDRDVPKLVDVDKTIVIDPSKALIQVNLRNGELEALRHPDSLPTDPDVAIISRLRVTDYTNPITIDINETGTKTRSLEIQAYTDIALANIGFPKDPKKLGDHFSIYGALTKKGTISGKSPTTSPVVTKIHRGYRIFELNIPISDGHAQCGSQGCCPPP